MQKNNSQNNPSDGSKSSGISCLRLKDESGIALVLVMIALALITLFAAYLAMTGVEELSTSDIGESTVQARFAARAGIEHSREVLRGLTFNKILTGPDGAPYANTTAYSNLARTAGFRNLAAWSVFRSLDLGNPSSSVSTIPDDGLINTGLVGTVAGTVLVPKTGNVFSVANPYGTGTLTTARYFLKVTDNNGDASETARDAADNPFIDGDGTIIVRSIGVARTIAEGTGATARRNSVVIYESRMQQGMPFANLGSPAVVIGSNIRANFSGNSFDIIGNGDGPGLATIDTDLTDAYNPSQILKTATGGKGNITGNCTGATASKCIADITASVMANPDKAKLRDPAWLYDFAYNQVPSMADYSLTGPVSLNSSNVGTTANPKITFVNGSCDATGNVSGAGLLVVTGDLTLGGAIRWDGLVLVIGKGELWTHGMNNGIYGGVIVAGVMLNGSGQAIFSPANTDFDIRGNSNIATYDGSLANLGNNMGPLKQVSFREVSSGMDP